MTQYNRKESEQDRHYTMDNLIQQEQNFGGTRETSQQKPNGFAADTKERKKGAVRMAGFMFWTNFAAGMLLLIGCYLYGWLTIKGVQKLHYSEYSYYNSGDDEKVMRSYVFQDYGLWYITQCNDPGIAPFCKTMSYRVIDFAYDKTCKKYHDCERIEFGSIERTEKSEFMIYSGAGLVFSYSEFVRMQRLYTMGLVISFAMLYYWYLFRKDVAEDKSISFSRTKWTFLLLLAILSAVFVLIPVFMFASIHAEIKDFDDVELKTPFGLVVAGSGGGMMALVSLYIFFQLICCRNDNNVYICSCLVEIETEMPQKEDDL